MRANLTRRFGAFAPFTQQERRMRVLFLYPAHHFFEPPLMISGLDEILRVYVDRNLCAKSQTKSSHEIASILAPEAPERLKLLLCRALHERRRDAVRAF